MNDKKPTVAANGSNKDGNNFIATLGVDNFGHLASAQAFVVRGFGCKYVSRGPFGVRQELIDAWLVSESGVGRRELAQKCGLIFRRLGLERGGSNPGRAVEEGELTFASFVVSSS